MAHCSFEKLEDLAMELDRIRLLPGIKEKTPGVFYFKSTPFLHFHEKDGRRWADVRSGKQWGDPVNIPFGASGIEKQKFENEIKRRYIQMGAR